MAFLKSLGGAALGGGGLGFLQDMMGGGGGGFGKILKELQRQQDLANAKAQGFTLRGLHEVRTGYDKGLADFERAGSTAKLDAEQEAERSTATLAQALGGRGWGGSSVADSIGRVHSADVGRTRGAIEAAIAGGRSSMLADKGMALRAGYGDLAQVAQSHGAAKTALGTFLLQYLMNKKKTSGIGGLIGGVAGSFLGPMGGAAGSALGSQMFGGSET